MANGITPRPNYQGGDVSIMPYLAGIGNILIANQQRAQEQAQEEKERADKLYDEVQKLSAKVNPAGILPADYDDFMNLYQNGIKKNMIDAMLARQNGDMKTYIEKIAKANEEIANANYLIGRSKARSEEYLKFQQSFKPEDYSDDTGEKLRILIETPTSKLGLNDTLVGNPAFMRRINTSKVPTQIDNMLKELFNTSAKLSGTSTTRAQGGNILEFKESVDKDAFADALRLRFASDPAFKAFARENNLGDTPEEAAINITALYEQQGRFNRTEGRQFVRDRAPSSGRGTDAQREATYRQQHIAGLFNKEPWAVADLIGAMGPGIDENFQTKVEYSPDGRYLTIERPMQMDDKGNIRYDIQETIDLTSPTAETALNRILNIVTGQNVTPGAYRTEGGRPRGNLIYQNPNQSRNNSVPLTNNTTAKPKFN